MLLRLAGCTRWRFLTIHCSLIAILVIVWNDIEHIDRLIRVIDRALVYDDIGKALHHICRDTGLPQWNELALITSNQLEKSFHALRWSLRLNMREVF